MSLGIGPLFVGVSSAANAGVAHHRAGLAAAIMTSSQQIGGAVGQELGHDAEPEESFLR